MPLPCGPDRCRPGHVAVRPSEPIGSGAEYLYNTVSHLEAFGIHDRNLWRLQELVADEVRAIHGHAVEPSHSLALQTP